jgi:hypothetical protein
MPRTKDWKGKTCEKCEYNINGECRRCPPLFIPLLICGQYPCVSGPFKSIRACAEYKESEAI